jgi:proline dehydrogenase
MIIKHSFFAHFCAGETEDEIKTVMARLRESGIGGIMDYAAENDVAPVEAPREREGVVSARTFDYYGEAECDKNAAIFEKSIQAVAKIPDSFAAIKITGWFTFFFSFYISLSYWNMFKEYIFHKY